MARSPMPRILAWDAVDGLLVTRQRRAPVVRFERGAHGAAGALIALASKRHHVRFGERVDDAVLAGGGQVVRRAGVVRVRPR
jgi:hypothetical protein